MPEVLMGPDSLLTGANAAFLDEQYRRWHVDPEAVEPGLRALFASLEPGQVPRGPGFTARSIFDPHPAVAPPAAPPAVAPAMGSRQLGEAAERQARVVQLINAFRVRGHIQARIDPLDRREAVVHPELTLEYYGLGPDDLDVELPTHPMYGMPERAKLRTILERLRRAYCSSIGAEFMNITDLQQRKWVQRALETVIDYQVLDRDGTLRILRKMSDAESFERLLHSRFPGTKRFSLEGAETLVPLLDLVVEHAAVRGTHTVILGMAHRGRLNTLANVLDKPVRMIVEEFGDTGVRTGDVKYHLGYSADVTTVRGHSVDLSMCFNPSHLEAVDPVVLGRVRAKQDRIGDTHRSQVLPVLVHGDAAFSGQGLVAEVLNLSELAGYRCGGTVHVIVNNQIGFTTPPHEARSTPYATDVARMLAVPIFHVNGEDPRAVAATTMIAMEWRKVFGRDVVIDMYCYRKYGHNEGDEPSFTQPLMYDAIRTRPTPRANYAGHLVDSGVIDEAEAGRILASSREDMEAAMAAPEEQASDDSSVSAAPTGIGSFPIAPGAIQLGSELLQSPAPGEVADCAFPLKGLWDEYVGSIHDEVDTSIPLDRLRSLLRAANTLPEGFNAHAKITRLLRTRTQMADGEVPVDWAVGEQAAFASLVTEGVRVRLSGQDSGRGTFSQRHAVLTDITTDAAWFPLQHLEPRQAPFHAIDSSLSEPGVLGFEFGYSLGSPDALVLWEAQFGDFANGAQVVIDQFIAASEEKWDRASGLVMLLPHGYEGQGPEHSSARLERYLQLCADENMQVANCTTPANYCHLLRRQALRKVRKPLVVMTPKSLLRHPAATSTLEQLAAGPFQAVIPEDEDLDPDAVRRVVLCSGKVCYDLLARRAERAERRVALVRVELLHPFPHDAVDQALQAWPVDAEVVWCQEEPRNMGAWPMALHWFLDRPRGGRLPRYVGRAASAATATGSYRRHQQEQARLVDEALTL